jgi:hypothetical protein
MEPNSAAARWLDRLGSAKDDQADFWRDAQAYWSADGAKAAIHVDMSHWTRSGGEERRAECASGRGVRSGAVIRGRRKERALVKAGDIVGDEARGAEAMVEDFDLDLPAMSVTGERKFDTEFGGAIESIGIVRKQNVGHVAPDKRLDTSKSLLALAAGSPFALVIDADEIELRALKTNLRVFVAQHFHARLRVEVGGFVFGASVDFVIAVAAPGAEGSVKTANFLDAIGDGIAGAGDEIAGNDGEVGPEIVGHIHGSSHLGAGHVAAEVDVADLDNPHAVEGGRQIGQGNLDAADLVIQALGSKAVHRGEEGSGAGSSRGGAEKVAAARVSNGFDSGRCGLLGAWLRDGFFHSCGMQPSPKTLKPMNRSHRDISKERAEKPEASENTHHGTVTGKSCAPEQQALPNGYDYQQKKNNVDQPGADSKRHAPPMRGDAPKSAVPETLGKKQQRQDARTDGDAKQQKAPIHGDGAPKV